MGSCARPFRDDILASLVVGRKGERDTGEGGTKINADNELCLAPVRVGFDGGIAHSVLLLRHAGRDPGSHGLVLHAVTRGIHLVLDTGLVLQGRVERGGVLAVLLAGNHRTRRTVIYRITRRATQLWLLLVHRKTCG